VSASNAGNTEKGPAGSGAEMAEGRLDDPSAAKQSGTPRIVPYLGRKRDDATVQIARRMLSMPPKPHDQMKFGKPTGKKAKSPARKQRSKKSL
jgi:hypothetical protein